MADVGIEYIRNTEADMKKLQAEVAVITEVTTRLKADISLEAKLRGGDISTLQHKFTGDLASEVAALRKETAEQVGAVRQQAAEWKEVVTAQFTDLKSNLAMMATEMGTRKEEIQALSKVANTMSQDIASTKKSLESLGLELGGKLAEVIAQATDDREKNSEAVKSLTKKLSEDTINLEGMIDSMKTAMEAKAKVVAGEFAAVSERLETVREFAATKAKETDVQAMEVRMHETVDKHVRLLNEDISRREYCTNVKALSDRLMTLTLDVNANDAKAKAGDDSLAKHIAVVEQSLAKAVRQADTDRDRCNEVWVSLERECHARAPKSDFDAAVVRLSMAESTLSPLVTMVASKADSLELRSMGSRVLALEQVYPTKADASELPKLHLMMADHAAKHEGLQGKSQDHHVRLEKLDDSIRDHIAKLDTVDNRTREVQAVLTGKADHESVHDKETMSMMMKDYYRREEVDSMMTRVWWRVGDSTKAAARPAPWRPGSS